MTTINPYLTFDGNCQEAFTFYKSVFGGEFTYIGKFKEMPENKEYPVPEKDKEKIMHVSLPISKESALMGSDTSESFGNKHVIGNNISISINAESVEEVKRLYNALTKDGKINMPLQETFWKSYFGMFTDKFGIHWQVNCELKEHKEFEEKNKK